jgi:hypothetical protein
MAERSMAAILHANECQLEPAKEPDGFGESAPSLCFSIELMPKMGS